MCGLGFTCRSSLQLHLSVHRAGSWLHHHRRAADEEQDEELDTNSDGERSKKEEILLPAPTKPSGWSKRGRHREEEEEGGGKEKGREKEAVEQPQRLRRNMVGPPIRYLLESEETSHGPVTANQGRAGIFKQHKKAPKRSNAGGGASADTGMIDRSVAAERQTGHMVTRLPASTKASDWWRCKKFGCKNPRWRFDHRTMRRRRQEEERWRRQECDGDGWRRTRWEEEKGQRTRREEGKETWMEVEQPQRPRRRMVGPPIRYLLESEEQSHVSVIQSDQSKAGVFKQDVRTQTKKKAGGGASDQTAMIDTKRTDRQAGQTDTYRQTGHTVSHRQTHQVSNDLQSHQVTLISPCCVRLQRLSLIG